MCSIIITTHHLQLSLVTLVIILSTFELKINQSHPSCRWPLSHSLLSLLSSQIVPKKLFQMAPPPQLARIELCLPIHCIIMTSHIVGILYMVLDIPYRLPLEILTNNNLQNCPKMTSTQVDTPLTKLISGIMMITARYDGDIPLNRETPHAFFLSWV